MNEFDQKVLCAGLLDPLLEALVEIQSEEEKTEEQMQLISRKLDSLSASLYFLEKHDVIQDLPGILEELLPEWVNHKSLIEHLYQHMENKHG